MPERPQASLRNHLGSSTLIWGFDLSDWLPDIYRCTANVVISNVWKPKYESRYSMGIVVPRAHHKCPPQFRRLYPPQHRMQRPACGEAEVNFISRYCGPHIAERIQPPRLMVSQSIVPKTGLPAYSFFVSSVTAQTWNLECKPVCRTFPDLSATVGTDGGFPLPTRLCRDSH